MNEELRLEEIGGQIEERQPKVVIPWEKIDEWIAGLSFKAEADPGRVELADPGDRRN